MKKETGNTGEMTLMAIDGMTVEDYEKLYDRAKEKSSPYGRGDDDSNFHCNVIPEMKCVECGEKSPFNYQPNKTKYPDGIQV